MSDPKYSALRGWLTAIPLSREEAEALSRVPEDVVDAFCGEVSCDKLSMGLNSWYPEKKLKSWPGICPVGNTGYPRLAAHQLMLADEVRMRTFADAIREVVTKGDVVVDVGTGTGILAFMAWRCGAKRVFAIEWEDIAQIAAMAVDKNLASDVITVIQDDARHVKIPQKADVLVSECLGSGGVGTTQVNVVLESRQRFLKAHGMVVPKAVSVIVAPVESILVELYLRFWSASPGGIDYNDASRWARDQMYTVVVRPEDLVARAEEMFRLKYDTEDSYSGFSAKRTFIACRSGIVHGLGLWFRAHLTDGIVLDTSPGQTLTHWYHAFLPLQQGIAIDAGEKLDIGVCHRYECDQSVWNWTASSNRRAILFEQSTWRTGMRGGRR